MKNAIYVLYYKVLRFFGYKLPEDGIPEGYYCYVPDNEKNSSKKEGDFSYYIKPCPYWKWINKEYKGCAYLGVITDDPVFGDQCKMCNVNQE